jgi:hypothetical protein
LAGISDWEELYQIENADELHETYENMRDVIDTSYIPLPLTYESMCQTLSTIFTFLKTHAIAMLKQDAVMRCDPDDPYRTSTEMRSMRRVGKMDYDSFVAAYEPILVGLYEILMSEHFPAVDNHAAASELFYACMHDMNPKARVRTPQPAPFSLSCTH